MNQFILDHDPRLSAQYHCDKHVNKLIVELFQMFGSTLRRYDAPEERLPLTKAGKRLKGGYHYHPVTRWIGDNRQNFLWSIIHALALCGEYEIRYKKTHSCGPKILSMAEFASDIPDGSITEWPQCFGKENEYLVHQEPVIGYRNYYNIVKSQAMKVEWNYGASPDWYEPGKLITSL